jgi:tetratricopeptide (TPR) repeat protein
MNPRVMPPLLERLGIWEPRPFLAAVGGLAVVLLVVRSSGGGDGSWAPYLAGALLLGVPLVATRLAGRAAPLFALLGAVGSVFALPAHEGVSLAVLLVHRMAYFAAPPLLLGLALSDRDRERFSLGPVHLYAPAVVMGVGAAVHLVMTQGAPATRAELRVAVAFYDVCYGMLIAVAIVRRATHADETRTREVAAAVAAPSAQDLEDQGRYALATRAYEREGDPGKAAECAERAGDWARAGRLYRIAGDDFQAAEMYSRAGMSEDALEAYERGGHVAAAARLSLHLGDVERATGLYARSGDAEGLVRALEDAGQRPTGEQYLRARQPARAAEAFEAAGQWGRAAEVYAHELKDVDRAAGAYLKDGAYVEAGRLLESMGRRQEALEAFALAPEGAIDAARLYLAAGRPAQAADMFAQVTRAQLDASTDEATLVQVARAMVDARRNDEALRVLQRLKRGGYGGGAVSLLVGRAFLAKRLPDLAEPELRAALILPLDREDEVEAMYLLACLLEGAQRKVEALEFFHRLLQQQFHYKDAQQRYRRLKASTQGPSPQESEVIP